MAEHNWGDLRQDATDHFGEPPGDNLEQRILTVFRAYPQMVADTIRRITRSYDNGQIRSPWPVIATDLEKQVARQAKARLVIVTDNGETDELTGRALRYIRQVGYLHQTEDELVTELFGRGGILATKAGDKPLEQQMLNLWRQTRPIGERVEQAASSRAEAWKQMRRQP